MTRYRLLAIAALAGLGVGSQDARAFTIINQGNYAAGGASGLAATDPNAALANRAAPPAQSASGLSFGFSNAPGYGGAGAFDFTNGSTSHDNFPTFPGADNHLTAGENVGILQYGMLPRRY